jgi:hypothetical protein
VEEKEETYFRKLEERGGVRNFGKRRRRWKRKRKREKEGGRAERGIS